VLGRIAMIVAALLVISSCRVDVIVDLVVRPDGTGELVVTATADADVVNAAPGVADDLRFDDLTAAGWAVEGPTGTSDGGLTVTLRHGASSAEEATNLLLSLGPPFADVRVDRTQTDDTATTALSGRLELVGGFDAFADSDLLAAVGGTPFADDLAAAGATPADSMSVVLRATLPGEIETTGHSTDGTVTWEAPLDGSSVDLATRGVQRPAPAWALIVSVTALVLLIAWVVLLVAVAVIVARRRWRRARRPSLERLEQLRQ
ncbi:MAG: hypothetical protein ACRDZ2_09720, partial [Ilumatobacteraceae bacterium]